MIQANSLRIGNWVSFKGLWQGTVREVGTSGVILIEGNDGIFDDENIQPIPITEQVLFACGFGRQDKIPIGYWKELPHYTVGKFEIFQEGDYKFAPTLPIRFLHQLQNLYFALTQTELNYKP